MEKIKHKFITVVILLIIGVIIVGGYQSYKNTSMNKETFVTLLNGNAKLNDHLLKVNQRDKIQEGDMIKTIGEASLAVLEWGDGSLTRLGGNSSVVITKNLIRYDMSQINIAFQLLNGKSWSNVISFMGNNSYFKETFRDTEAAVRGTIFDVDLENDYVSVIKHQILLTQKSGQVLHIGENQPFSLKTFSFLQLNEFLSTIQNNVFEELNGTFDIAFIQGLSQNIQNQINNFPDIGNIDIASLSQEKKDQLYATLLQKYQTLNFVDGSNIVLFEKKLAYKNALINLAPEGEKKPLLESTLTDLKDTIESNDIASFTKILPILKDNVDTLTTFHLDVTQYMNVGTLSDDFKNALNHNVEILQNIFPNFSLINVNNTLLDIKTKTQSTIENGLNTLFNK